MRFVRFGLLAFGLLGSAAPAYAAPVAQPPRPGCAAVDKREYDAARKRNLRQSRYGEYVRTGRVLRRQYWYCH